MKWNKWISCLIMGNVLHSSAFAQIQCFIFKEHNQIIEQTGECLSRHAPCSTFKVPLSLMGYNEGILIDETHPVIPFQEGYDDYLPIWRQAYYPRLWLQNSCLWFSRIITKQLGMPKFQQYVTSFEYGNQNLSGDKGKNNGLTNAWLSSSLEISPVEQMTFLQKLLDNQLPVTQKSHDMTKNNLFLEVLPGGWKLYGKTGSGSQLTPDRMMKTDKQIGWFIGWIEKGNRQIAFVQYIQDEDKQAEFGGYRAKAAAKEKILMKIPYI